jgi:hypothetical protein
MRTSVSVGLILLVAVAGVPLAAVGTQSTAADEGQRPIDIDTDRVNVYLQAQQTKIGDGESVIFVHSATNYITNERPLTVQLLLEAPSGSDVFATSGVEQGSGSQFNTVTTLAPGEQESFRIQAEFHDPGEYEITAQAVYFFGQNRSGGDGVEVTIPVEQRPPPPSASERVVRTATESLSVYGSLVRTIETPLRTDSQPSASQSMTPPGIAPFGVSMFVIVGYTAAVWPLSLIVILLLWLYLGLIGRADLSGDQSDEWNAAQGFALFVTLGAVILAVLDLLSLFGSGAESFLITRFLAALVVAIPVTLAASLLHVSGLFLWAHLAR